MLIRHLPAGDSAVLRALHGEGADWSVTDHLLANAVDYLAAANWMFATVNSDPDAAAIDFPDPTPRPGAGTPVSASASITEPDPSEDHRIRLFFGDS
ncbi:hypothetical protein [Embleya sp. NBC_00888]|uniref:hypothetical protein n=1 Tax=Embleya sp. NBC_00888 TaxID=2975960 RepID=UPI00386E2553